ncbi:MAG TPA: PH domain-containing protein [Acidobacteriota bacterium]
MAYLDQLIASSERVLYRTRRHRLVLLRACGLALALAALGLGVAVGFSVWAAHQPAARTGLWSGLALLILGLGLALPAYLRWHCELYVVTDRRVLQAEGVLSKRVLDSNLAKVNDVLLTQSFWGRLLNYGSIEILTASEAGVNRLDWIPRPLKFKRAMLDAKAHGEPAEPQDDRPGPQRLADQLAQLEELRKKGLLQEAEYKAKRAEILSRI